MSKLILINGPIGCGKSEAVKHLKKYFPLVDRRCKDKLFTLTMEFFCVQPERFWEVYNNRELKEVPLPDFQLTKAAYNQLRAITGACEVDSEMVNVSIRGAMIYVSEVLCKPSMGVDYFGRARALSIAKDELAIDDSCGFAEELPPTIERVGQDNLLLIRVHGRGTFEGDSRGYIPDGIIINTTYIYNDKEESGYLLSMLSTVSKFLNPGAW